MKGVVFLGNKRLEIMDRPDPVPDSDEVVLQVKASGMCGSDLHHYCGAERPTEELAIAGHEPCGVVIEVGSAVRPVEATVGDRVIVHHYDGCRVCPACRSGWTQSCASEYRRGFGWQADGGHAPFMRVPAHTLIRMPEELSFKAGAAAACGTGTAYSATKRVGLVGDETVAIFGQGPVGLSATLFAKTMGAQAIAIDIATDRLEMAANLGADVLINAADADPVAVIHEVTRRAGGADKAIECSGNPAARGQALASVRKWGTVCLVGVGGNMEFDADEVIRGMKSVVGVHTFSKNILTECAAVISERDVAVESVFTSEFGLEQAVEAYELFEARKIGKGVFVFD